MLKLQDENIIDKNAKYHVFIGTDSSRETYFAYLVCRYSLHSLASEDISIIQIPKEHKLLVPSICKNNGLKGKALFITEQMLFRDDIIQAFNSLQGEYNLWVIKYANKELKNSFIIFNLDNLSLYNLLPENKVLHWKPHYSENFHWISRSPSIVDLEVGSISPDWNYYPGITNKEFPEAAIKAFNISKTITSSAAKAHWNNELKLYLTNEVLPQLT